MADDAPKRVLLKLSGEALMGDLPYGIDRAMLGTIAQPTSGSFKHIHGWVPPDELNSTAGPEHALNVLSLPGRNPRQTKAFINLWRFQMLLDHRMGLFSPSLLTI